MRNILIGAVTVLIALTGCTKPAREFRVALQSIPSKIDPRENTINIFQYINLHAYYSLFERGDLGELKSEFLDLSQTRALDAGHTKFQLCIKQDLKFSDDSPVRAEDLRFSLAETHRVKPNLMPLKQIEENGACVLATLDSPDRHYFSKLVTQQTTVLKKGTERDRIPVGLGPYRVSSLTADRVILQALEKRVHGDFKRVEFVRVGPDLKAVKHDVHDWNHLYHMPIPERARQEYREVKRPLLKTYFILVDIEGYDLRQQIASCFNRKEFVRKLGLSLTEAPGYLPRGLPGTNVQYEPLTRRPAAECRFSASDAKLRIPYYSYNEYLHEKVRDFFEAASPNLPVEVVPRKVNLDETIKDAFLDKRMLTLVGADASQPSPEGFFAIFISDEKPIAKRIPGLKQIVEAAAKTSDAATKNQLFEKAHRMLLQSGYMIPLGQLVTSQYYPKYVQNIRLVDRVQGFPQIDQMEYQ